MYIEGGNIKQALYQNVIIAVSLLLHDTAIKKSKVKLWSFLISMI